MKLFLSRFRLLLLKNFSSVTVSGLPSEQSAITCRGSNVLSIVSSRDFSEI